MRGIIKQEKDEVIKVNQIETKAVRSKRMAWQLRKAGFRILSVEPDRRKPEYNVYIFERTADFQAVFDNIIAESQRQKE